MVACTTACIAGSAESDTLALEGVLIVNETVVKHDSALLLGLDEFHIVHGEVVANDGIIMSELDAGDTHP
jgi:hypothetical protein